MGASFLMGQKGYYIYMYIYFSISLSISSSPPPKQMERVRHMRNFPSVLTPSHLFRSLPSNSPIAVFISSTVGKQARCINHCEQFKMLFSPFLFLPSDKVGWDCVKEGGSADPLLVSLSLSVWMAQDGAAKS